jgi:recombination protein RecR
VSTLPALLEQLERELTQLPGIGPRSAARIALHLVQSDPSAVNRLATTLLAARERIACCQVCGALTESQPCPLCSDPERDAALLCVVERPVDVLALERSRSFRGRYHVLGGVLSPLNGIGPEDLRIDALEHRLTVEPVREIVVALATSVEGDATSHYLAGRLAGRGVRVSRIGYGLPAGSGIEFVDEITLSRALDSRREMSP